SPGAFGWTSFTIHHSTRAQATVAVARIGGSQPTMCADRTTGSRLLAATAAANLIPHGVMRASPRGPTRAIRVNGCPGTGRLYPAGAASQRPQQNADTHRR